MCKVRFGPSGNSESFYEQGYKNTEQAAEWLSKMGLSAFEYSFGRGTKISEKKALLIGEKMSQFDIEISAHAPYYINFANPDDEMIEKSFGYVLSTAEKLKLMGGKRVVFHPASVGKNALREDAFNRAYENMKKLAERIYAAGYEDMIFCPETMGKINQIGDFHEIAKLCSIDDVFVPTVDFGHQNARTLGGLKTQKDFDEIISCFISEIGENRTKMMHIHFSKIEYTKGGEVRHLTFDTDTLNYGPSFEPLAASIKKFGLCPVVICESAGTQAEDALKMKNIYEAI